MGRNKYEVGGPSKAARVETPAMMESAKDKAEKQMRAQELMSVMGEHAYTLFANMKPGQTLTFTFGAPPSRIQRPNAPPPQPQTVGQLVITKPSMATGIGIVLSEEAMGRKQQEEVDESPLPQEEPDGEPVE